jgi:hypothetical protein
MHGRDLVSDADRDALLDLLGAVETVGLRGSRDLAAIDAARQRVRRHLDRTSTEPGGDRDTDAARSILRRFGLHANTGATLWVAEVIAGRYVEGRDDARRPFEELFAGGPETVCRTVYRTGTVEYGLECVEVPIDDLRDAFETAGGTP